jgi:hypothetical protein
MASTLKNPAGQIIKLTRGFSAKLGTIAASGDVVAFTVPEPSFMSQGFLVIQGVGGTTPTFALEVSLDGGTTWFTFPTTSTTGVEFVFALTGQPGGDTAASFAAQYNIGGFGSGALFKFGRTDANGGNTIVWALVG